MNLLKTKKCGGDYTMPKLYYESKPGELEHGLFGTTKKREGAKYIHKIDLGNGKYRYFYTQQELDAYNAMNKVGAGIKKTAANIKEGIADAAGKRYYDEAAKYDSEYNKLIKSQQYNMVVAKNKKIEQDAKKRASDRGLDGAEIYDDKQAAERDAAAKALRNLKFKAGELDFKRDQNKKRGDDSLYGRYKWGKEKFKDQVNDAKKQVNDVKKEVKKQIDTVKKEVKKTDAYKAVKEASDAVKKQVDTAKKEIKKTDAYKAVKDSIDESKKKKKKKQIKKKVDDVLSKFGIY